MLAGEQAVTTAAPFEWDVDMFLDPERISMASVIRGRARSLPRTFSPSSRYLKRKISPFPFLTCTSAQQNAHILLLWFAASIHNIVSWKLSVLASTSFGLQPIE